MILDSLAERYGLLPGEVLERATSFDLWVFDVAISYRNYRAEQDAKGNKSLDQVASKPQIDQAQLLKDWERFREHKGKK